MNDKKAKNPKEVKALRVDLEAKANKFKEVTGKAPDEDWHKSIIRQMLDSQSLTQMMIYDAEPLAVFKRKVTELAAAMTASSSGGQFNQFGEKEPDKNNEPEEPWKEEDWDGDEGTGEGEEQGQFNSFGEKCWWCGGFGHYQRECPKKGAGKAASQGGKFGGKGGGGKAGGKGSGAGGKKGGKSGGKSTGGKFGGKGAGAGGKGPKGGCFKCGGAHYQADCPKNKGGGGGGGFNSFGTLAALSRGSMHGSEGAKAGISYYSGEWYDRQKGRNRRSEVINGG